jgi:uncharacterized protein (DUF924 family)
MNEIGTPAAVLDFWFGGLDASGRAAESARKRWWQKDAAFDRQIRERFGPLHAVLLGGAFPEWRREPRSVVAYVIVLDQFSRNMYRDSAGMYVSDELALQAAFEAIALGFDQDLPLDLRVFLYMPLMHSERVEVQRRCVQLFSELVQEVVGEAREAIAGNLHYAEQHLVIVERFGRFPHRNALLGRTSTPEEIEFLKEPGSSF